MKGTAVVKSIRSATIQTPETRYIPHPGNPMIREPKEVLVQKEVAEITAILPLPERVDTQDLLQAELRLIVSLDLARDFAIGDKFEFELDGHTALVPQIDMGEDLQ